MSDDSRDYRLALGEHDSRVTLVSNRDNLADDDCPAFPMRDRAHGPEASASCAGGAA